MVRAAPDKHRQDIMKAVDMLKVLSHPLRLAILCDLLQNGEMTAGQIVDAESGSYSQSQISQYLAILRDMDYVDTRKEGQTVWYRIKSGEVKKLLGTLEGIFCGTSKK